MDNDYMGWDIEDLLKEKNNDRSNSRTSRDSGNSTVHSSTSGWSQIFMVRDRPSFGPDRVNKIEELLKGIDNGNNSSDMRDSSDLFRDSTSDSSDGLSGGESSSELRDGTSEESLGRVQEGGDTELPELPKGITQETVDRVASSAWLSHTLEGSVNVEFIKQNLPKNVYLPKGWTLGKVLLLPHVARKLEARGVPKPDESDILSPKQIQALVVITNARNMKWAARLKQAGVTVAEWQSWLKQPNFRMVYDKYAEGRLRDAIPEGISALSDKAADGDLNAVKLVLEMTGRHDPNGGKEVNIQAILVGIVEILQQEVSDMEVLMRVVNRIKGLQTGIGIGTGNIKGEIE